MMSEPHLPNQAEAGFTLIELMVSVTLMLVIIGTALTGFRHVAEASEGVTLASDLNVTLRSVVNLMTRDLLSAGRGIPIGGVAIPSGDDVLPILRPSVRNDLAFPVATTLPAVSPGDALGLALGDDPGTARVEGTQTDVVSILMTDPSLALDQLPLAAIAADGREVTVDDAIPIDVEPDSVKAGDLIMLSNARGTALMMVTARAGQVIQFAAGDPMRLNQLDTATAGTILNLQIAPGVYPPTTATRILMISYYLEGTSARPMLMRRVNMSPPRAVGVAVENLQLTYDIVDGVNNPVNQPSPPVNQIRKANLFLSGRSYREWRRSDEFLRISVAGQVSLRSLALVDRYE
jgi:prepilin-type N-terminal cleavage/methylation domain-containing protein